jgi:hypothetical protein
MPHIFVFEVGTFFFFFFVFLFRIRPSGRFPSGLIWNYRSCRRSVGLLRRGISPVLKPLPTHRRNADRHLCLGWDWNPRSECFSGRSNFVPQTSGSLWSTFWSFFLQNYVIVVCLWNIYIIRACISSPLESPCSKYSNDTGRNLWIIASLKNRYKVRGLSSCKRFVPSSTEVWTCSTWICWWFKGM